MKLSHGRSMSTTKQFYHIRKFLFSIDKQYLVDNENHGSREALVDRKYFYAGCSVRWMFAMHVPSIM
jgi:hypothetical protein